MAGIRARLLVGLVPVLWLAVCAHALETNFAVNFTSREIALIAYTNALRHEKQFDIPLYANLDLMLAAKEHAQGSLP